MSCLSTAWQIMGEWYLTRTASSNDLREIEYTLRVWPQIRNFWALIQERRPCSTLVRYTEVSKAGCLGWGVRGIARILPSWSQTTLPLDLNLAMTPTQIFRKGVITIWTMGQFCPFLSVKSFKSGVNVMGPKFVSITPSMNRWMSFTHPNIFR
jgi:hypothetical protein